MSDKRRKVTVTVWKTSEGNVTEVNGFEVLDHTVDMVEDDEVPAEPQCSHVRMTWDFDCNYMHVLQMILRGMTALCMVVFGCDEREAISRLGKLGGVLANHTLMAIQGTIWHQLN